MPNARVDKEGVVSLNQRLYNIVGQVTRDLISVQPPKVSIGPYTKDDNPVVSTITWDNFRDGIGKEIVEQPVDFTRLYYGSMLLDQRSPLPMPIAASPLIVGSNSSRFLFFQDGYSTSSIAGLTSLKVWNITNAARTSARALADQPTDVTIAMMTTAAASTALKPHIVVATASNVDYAHDLGTDLSAAVWARNATDISYVKMHHDALWGINSTGTLYFTKCLSTGWTQVATLPYRSGTVTGLMEGILPNREMGLYVVTDRGLYAYNQETEQIVPSGFVLPGSHPNGGRAFAYWNGANYWSAGMSLFKVVPTGGETLVQDVGLARNDGLPPDFLGQVTALVPSARYLYAQVDEGNEIGSRVTAMRPAIYRWNERAWDTVRVGTTAASTTDAYLSRPIVTYDYSSGGSRLYALMFGLTQTSAASSSYMVLIKLPPETINLAAVSSQEYMGGDGTINELITPWIQKDSAQRWLAVQFEAQTHAPSTRWRYEFYYGLDFSTAFTSLGTSSQTEVLTFNLTTATSTADYQGIAFSAIRFRATVTQTNNPATQPIQLRRMTLVYKKTINPTYAFTFYVDARKDSGQGYTPREIREALEAAAESTNLVEFSFKDELSATNVSEQHWVHVQKVVSQEGTGPEDSVFQVTVAEAV